MKYAIMVALMIAGCGRFQYTPDPKWAGFRDSPDACLVADTPLSQRYADRILPPCEELRKPEQRIYMVVMSEEEGHRLLQSGHFGSPPPFREVRGYYVGYRSYVDAYQIVINETVLRDGAERALLQHEFCHTPEFRGDPICDPHNHGPPGKE